MVKYPAERIACANSAINSLKAARSGRNGFEIDVDPSVGILLHTASMF